MAYGAGVGALAGKPVIELQFLILFTMLDDHTEAAKYYWKVESSSFESGVPLEQGSTCPFHQLVQSHY